MGPADDWPEAAVMELCFFGCFGFVFGGKAFEDKAERKKNQVPQ